MTKTEYNTTNHTHLLPLRRVNGRKTTESRRVNYRRPRSVTVTRHKFLLPFGQMDAPLHPPLRINALSSEALTSKTRKSGSRPSCRTSRTAQPHNRGTERAHGGDGAGAQAERRAEGRAGGDESFGEVRGECVPLGCLPRKWLIGFESQISHLKGSEFDDRRTIAYLYIATPP